MSTLSVWLPNNPSVAGPPELDDAWELFVEMDLVGFEAVADWLDSRADERVHLSVQSQMAWGGWDRDPEMGHLAYVVSPQVFIQMLDQFPDVPVQHYGRSIDADQVVRRIREFSDLPAFV